ncbi:hypothetical protein [Actinoplanes teichomyceticus]|uniref:Uncharacterized protein n=1 Tax=Actinoplanes teichomyceticus TaxID=1867 RepID=A0A561VM87_ACTTI|nr:hypothetical protein [Actinoplanes teichomyceticus]TWG12739.1 hypothetical protein FHX34_105607 [Actinoplanes teichomyceticus]GIF13472.1 hypothetical protein Ate01nite_35040 [Actinoplanes teichomyceticus]
MFQPRQRWRRPFAAALVAVCAATGVTVAAPAARAGGAVVIDATVLHHRLFAASAGSRVHGTAGLRQVMLGADLAAHRQLHPEATAQQLTDRATAVDAWYDSQLTAQDMQRPAYEFVVRMLAVTAKAPQPSTGAPLMRQLAELVIGTPQSGAAQAVDEIAAAQLASSVWAQVYPVQEQVFTTVATLAAADDVFATVFTGRFAASIGVDPRTGTESLLDDPVLTGYADVRALLQKADDRAAFLDQGDEALRQLLADVNAQVAATNQTLADLNARFPVQGANPTQAVLDQAKAQAAQRQVWIDRAGTVAELLGKVVGFADARAGQVVAGAGRAAVQVAGALNTWLPSIAGKGLAAALTSMSTLTMTGNVLGAIGALVPLFSGQQTPEQQILDQLGELRQQVGALATTMEERFKRVDTALNGIYTAMLKQFETLLQLHDATSDQLRQITVALAALTERVDFWGKALFENDRANAMFQVQEIINATVHHRARTGVELSYDKYADAANSLQLHAVTGSRRPMFVAPLIDPDPARPAPDLHLTLDTYRYHGAISFLRQYGDRLLGSAVARPLVGDVEAWLTAADGYQLLSAQNPAHAGRVWDAEWRAVAGSGTDIQNLVRTFSEPRPAGTQPRLNPLFTRLLDDYEAAAAALGARLREMQAGVHGPGREQYDLFGQPDQPVPNRPAAEPASIAPCGTAGNHPALSRPSTVRVLDIPQEVYVGAYARPDTGMRVCYRASWVNVQEPEEPPANKPYARYADLSVTFEVQLDWNGRTPDVVRSWTRVFPYGKIAQIYPPGDSRKSWTTPLTEPLGRWSGTYRTSFEQSAGYVANDATVKGWVRDWVYGQAGRYYQNVVSELRATDGALFQLNSRLSTAARLVEVYTRLGFARTLQQDELLAMGVLGAERIPSDHRRADVSGPLLRARDAYCKPEVTDRCVLNDRVIEIPASVVPCARSGPGDPVEKCLTAIAAGRSAGVRARLEAASVRLAGDPGYQEGIPAVERVVQGITTARAVAVG